MGSNIILGINVKWRFMMKMQIAPEHAGYFFGYLNKQTAISLQKVATLEPHKVAGTDAFKEEKEWPSEFREKIRESIFSKLATDRSRTLSQIMAEVQREFNINPTDVARVYMKG